MTKFDERVELKNKLDEIKKDIFANYPKNINVIDDYLKVFQNDETAMMIKSLILIDNYEYDLAIKELKNILIKFPNNKKALKKIFLLYYYTRRYQEAYDIILDVYKANCFSSYGARVMEIFIEHQLGLKTNLDIKETYLLKQLKHYNQEEAIKHIKEHIYIEELDGNNPEITFNKRINLKKLIQITKENIKNAKRSSRLGSCDTYFFALQNVGSDNDNIYNVLKVVVLPETDNIVAMYPCGEEVSKDINYLNMMGISVYKDEYIKDSSQIDKFNRRFNK